jgi:putative ABC transport system permease protein
MLRVEAFWADFKVGLRMLVKHPVLTIIGAVATTFAIGAGGAYFEIVNDYSRPSLPLQDGLRVVTIRNDDLAVADTEDRALHDFTTWRNELRTVEDLSVYTLYSRNLGLEGRVGLPVEVVEISAAAFRVARIPPLLGRSLVEADEQTGALPIAVIGEHLWETRFNRDPNIVGQSVQLGSATPTIVGVMPATFALPMNQSLWVPFRQDPLRFARREGPAIGTIGRLAPGATFEQAQAELTLIGARLAAEYPETNAQLRPRILPYLAPFTGEGIERSVRLGANGIFLILVLVICGNIGALVFARTAARERELTVRAALGASRARIVTQLFIEALVLNSVGAIISLATLHWGLRAADNYVWTSQGGVPPFWRDANLSLTTVIYVAGLTGLGAVIIGVLPALKLTRGGIQSILQRTTAGNAGMRSRTMSTAVIVVQVALSGALIPIAMAASTQLTWREVTDFGIRGSDYLTLRYDVEDSRQFDATYQKLRNRLLAEDGVTRVTVANQLPGTSNGGRMIEVEGDEGVAASGEPHRVRSAMVDVNYFDTFAARTVAGRLFNAGDLASDVTVVNEPFVQDVLGGRNAIGRRFRYAAASPDEKPSQWYEIVGVVPDLGMSPFEPLEAKGAYHVVAPAQIPSGFMAIRVGRNPESFIERVRSVAAAVDPGFLIYDAKGLDKVSASEIQANRLFFLAVGVGIGFVIFLSAAVTFALMSFTVSQRTREIGIRKALGASSQAVLRSVFSRAFVQLALGAGLGALASLTFLSNAGDGQFATPGVVVLVLAFMMLVGFVSCGPPARRALRIQPTEAMREDQ